MTGLHLAVSVGFGLVGVAFYFGGRMLFRTEKRMKKEREKAMEHNAIVDTKRVAAVLDLEDRIKVALTVGPEPSSGFAALVTMQKDLEKVFYKWLSEQKEGLFYVLSEDMIRVSGISNGAFKYELPESIRKFKRK